jgi:5-methylcytosine-specific restriction protein B
VPDATEQRLLSADAVNDAIRALSKTHLKTQTESMLRVFLCFSAIARAGETPSTPVIKKVVDTHFVLLPTPAGVADKDYTGTIGLRGTKEGKPYWLRNDSSRGSFLDYAGPTSPGRHLFHNERWQEPLNEDAVKLVTSSFDPARHEWPPSDALAAVLLASTPLDAGLNWQEVIERAWTTMGLEQDEWERVTSDPVLSVMPFAGDAWEPSVLAPDLRPPGVERVVDAEEELSELPVQVAAEVERVLQALRDHGKRAIVALAGVPGTSKSHTARRAARIFASQGCVSEIQFSPAYTYEEFMEGPRFGDGGKIEVELGVFLALNKSALKNEDKQYVLLIEELTRADIPRVLGELLTYIEYRGESDTFTTIYKRDEERRIAPNLAILATYNPTDSSAVSVDAALLRRMRVLDFPPSVALLRELLSDNGVDDTVIDQLVSLFDKCRDQTGEDRFAESMPFGHAVFAEVTSEADLYPLWCQELKPMMVRPHTPEHELYETIRENFPWHQSATYRLGTLL